MSASTPGRAAPCFSREARHRALLLHTDPDEVMQELELCEGLDWAVATSVDEVRPALETHNPEIVFSIKTSSFPGFAHAEALAWPNLRWFHVGGSGRDHLGSWEGGRVRVTDCAGVLAPFLAERTMAGLLYLATGLHGHLRAQIDRSWQPSRFRALSSRTLLVVGVGHTGAAFASLARAFGMRVIGVRASGMAHPMVDEMVRPDRLMEVLPRADVLSLHVRLDATTRALISRRELASLPGGAIVLNAARGAVLESAALLEALDRNIAGAWLDVFEEEPLPASHALWRHPRVVVSPHCADQVLDFPLRFAERFAALWKSRP